MHLAEDIYMIFLIHPPYPSKLTNRQAGRYCSAYQLTFYQPPRLLHYDLSGELLRTVSLEGLVVGLTDVEAAEDHV